MKLSDNSCLSDSINISGSELDNSRSKPYRIKIPQSSIKRHDRSYESSSSETEIKFNGRITNFMANRKINPLDIESNRQEYYHPYAHQPTPFEKLQAFFADFGENSWFLVYEGVGWTIDKLWGLTVALLLLPIALLGLLLDFLRQKVNDHVSIFQLISTHFSVLVAGNDE